jgi:LmbE family N-acetylglucosaminyl deacetylase
MNKVIDEHNIDIVYTHWDKDVHQDHSAIGKATFNAARHVKNVLMYRSNWYHTSTEFRGNYYSDISDFMDTKIASVKAHVNEYEKFGQGWVDFFVNENANAGKKIGCKYAEQFEIVKCYV